jgi:hypothetical protein
LLLVIVGAAAIGPTLRLVCSAIVVGQAFRLLLLPAAGLLQDLWMLSWLIAPALASSDDDAPPSFYAGRHALSPEFVADLEVWDWKDKKWDLFVLRVTGGVDILSTNKVT